MKGDVNGQSTVVEVVAELLLGEADLPFLKLPSVNGDYHSEKKRAQAFSHSRMVAAISDVDHKATKIGYLLFGGGVERDRRGD